jgi:uncharacterized protein YjbJ (UPF0337 family)
MKASTKNELKGALHQVAGSVKTEIGKDTNNPELAAKGDAEYLKGTIQRKVGQVQKVVEK